MRTERKWLLIMGLMVVLLIQGGLMLRSTSAWASARTSTESCTDVSFGRSLGIGMCFVHNDLGFCVKNWTTDATAVSACLLAASGGGRPWVFTKAEGKLVDTCYWDGYMMVGAGIPMGSNIDQQRFDLGVGIEWSFPDLTKFAFSVEAGISLVHYYDWYWGGWHWRSETFMGVGVDFYF